MSAIDLDGEATVRTLPVKVHPSKPGRVAIVRDEATDCAADDSQWESFGEEAAG